LRGTKLGKRKNFKKSTSLAKKGKIFGGNGGVLKKPQKPNRNRAERRLKGRGLRKPNGRVDKRGGGRVGWAGIRIPRKRSFREEKNPHIKGFRAQK